MDVAHGGMPAPRTCTLPFLNLTLIVVVFCRCWNNVDASSLLCEPPYTEPYVRWCGRTAEVTPPPTRSNEVRQSGAVGRAVQLRIEQTCHIRHNRAVEEPSEVKTVIWVGSSRRDLKLFPTEVKDVMGYALYQAQIGVKAFLAKPLSGFGGAGVLEIVEDHRSDTYRTVYTVKFADFVYVLHAFQKKSKKGIATPKLDLDLIKKRLKIAEDDYKLRGQGRGVSDESKSSGDRKTKSN